MSKKQEKNNQPSDNASLPGDTQVYGYQVDQQVLAQAEAQVAPVWQVGDVILDTYEVTGILGEGGMGLVYRVHHRGWNTDLAVKSLRPEFFQSEAHRENFMETWVNLGLHPHMVSCYYVRTLGGIPRLFAEYVEGGSLKDWIDRRRLYEGGKEKALERMLDIAIQMAWGLGYAHEQGVIHQDVKPANVMMTQDGTAKVTGFGMARARAAAGEAESVGKGRSILVSSGGMTPAYCSPEQAAKEKVTSKTDIWSWGVSVLEMFTGEVTWLAGQAAAEVLKGYLEGEGHENDLPAMPQDVVELLQRCFQADPAARPVDMAELTASLASIYEQTVGQPYPRRIPEVAKLRADALNNRAISYIDLSRTKDAMAVFEQALAIDPQHLEATYNAGLIAWRAGHITDDALLTRLHEVQTSLSGDWMPFYLQALVHLERDDCQSALEVLDNIQDPDAARPEVASARKLAHERLPHSRRLLRVFEGHTGDVTSVALSTDGCFALTGGYDFIAHLEHTIKLWELATGECLRVFKGHTDYVTSVALSADGRFALSGSKDKTLRLWELSTCQCLRVFEGHTDGVYSVALSADGRFALSGSKDKTLRLWELATGECLRTFEGHTHGVRSVALSTDGRFALSGSEDKTLRLWELSTCQCLRVFEGHTGDVTSVTLSADGRSALSGSNDKTLRQWDTATGNCLRIVEGHTDYVRSVTLSVDGRFALACGGSFFHHDYTIRSWDLASGKCMRVFEGHTGEVTSVVLSANGRFFLSSSNDRTVRLWILSLEEPWILAPIIPAQVQLSDAALVSQSTYDQALLDAKQALLCGEIVIAAKKVRIARSCMGFERGAEAQMIWCSLYQRLPKMTLKAGWEVEIFEGHTGDVTSVALSADGRFALSGSEDKTLRLWELATGECLRVIKEHISSIQPNSVDLSADGHFTLCGSEGNTFRLWDVTTGKCLRVFKGHKDFISSIALSIDGRFVLSGSSNYDRMDEPLRLWKVSTGKCLRVISERRMFVDSVDLSSDGRIALSASDLDSVFDLWDLSRGERLRVFEGHTRGVTSVALSTDECFALSGSEDKTLRLWELSTCQCLRVFEGHTDGVTSVALSTDGRFALSGSKDKTLRLWELSTCQCLRIFEGHTSEVHSVALSADGRFALSGGSDNTLRLWFLDWELDDRQPADWDEGARPYLEIFLTLRTPYVSPDSLERKGKPTWNEEDFQKLLTELGHCGYGWLRPEGVRRELEKIARDWQGPPRLGK